MANRVKNESPVFVSVVAQQRDASTIQVQNLFVEEKIEARMARDVEAESIAPGPSAGRPLRPKRGEI